MKNIVKEAISAVIDYIDEMEYGESTTTRFILGSLGYELSIDEMIEVDFEAAEEIESSRDYVMDKSAHDGLIEGLPFNLDFVKIKKV